MFQIHKFMLLVSFLSISKCFPVEIAIIDKDPSMSLKIICNSSSDNLNLGKKDKVLWHGTQLGKDDLQKLSRQFGVDLLIYNLSIKASKKHKCYLVAPESLLIKLEKIKLGIWKTRMTRDDGTASLPMENGVCPPGYRIDEDRCFPCFPGSYTSGQQTECFLCPKDFYMDKKAADACWPCPEGKNTLAQGADSEESCINLDEKGHAQIKQSPPWIAIYVVLSVIILCLWILTIYLLIRYWKKRGKDGADKGTFFRRKKASSKKRLSADDHLYERISDTDKEEPIYAEIGDYGDEYEEPKKPSQSHDYVDLEAPTLPPRRKDNRIGPMQQTRSETRSEDQYEVPISRSEPIRKRSEELYEVPIERILSEITLDDQYVIPIRRQSNQSYVEFLGDSEDHIYSEINSDDVVNSDDGGNDTNVISSRSLPYVPESFSTDSIRQKPSGLSSDSKINVARKH